MAVELEERKLVNVSFIEILKEFVILKVERCLKMILVPPKNMATCSKIENFPFLNTYNIIITSPCKTTEGNILKLGWNAELREEKYVWSAKQCSFKL